jgi:hypothetical protein
MLNTLDTKFIKAVKAMENRTARVRAYVIVNPANPDHAGRIVISYPKDGAGRVHAIAWLPDADGHSSVRHHGSASGYGYDKATAAMGGAEFDNLKTGGISKLVDQGHDFRHQLEAAGYLVFQAV